MDPLETESHRNLSRSPSPGADVDYIVRIPASRKDEVLGLRDVINALRQRIWLIAACTAAGLAVAGLVIFLTDPIYRAEVLLVPVEDDKPSGMDLFASEFGDLSQLAGLNLSADSNVWVPISILKSRSFAELFITERNLLPVLFADDWDAEAGDWKASVKDDPPTLWDAYEYFDDDIRSVEWNSTTQLVVLSIQWTDPQVAAEWANALVTRVNDTIRQQVIDESNKSIGYLNRELAKTNVVGLSQAIYRLLESQIEKIMRANVRVEYAFRTIDPAKAPDPDDYVWPNIPLILLIGFFVGLMIGVSVAITRYVWTGAGRD